MLLKSQQTIRIIKSSEPDNKITRPSNVKRHPDRDSTDQVAGWIKKFFPSRVFTAPSSHFKQSNYLQGLNKHLALPRIAETSKTRLPNLFTTLYLNHEFPTSPCIDKALRHVLRETC